MRDLQINHVLRYATNEGPRAGYRGQTAAKEYQMSSSEQAPEPTMDEILASIRKIIADDEQQEEAAQEQGGPAPEAAAPSEGQGSLAEDIENALNQPAGEAAPAAPPAAEEDIFDLTNEVTEEITAATQTAAAAAPVAEPAAMPEPAPEPAAVAEMPAPPPEAVMTPPSELQDLPHAGADVLSGTPMTESPLPEDAAGFGTPEAGTPAGPEGDVVMGQAETGDAPAPAAAPEAPVQAPEPVAEAAAEMPAEPVEPAAAPPAADAGAFEMPAPTPLETEQQPAASMSEPVEPPQEPLAAALEPDTAAAPVMQEEASGLPEAPETGGDLAAGGAEVAGPGGVETADVQAEGDAEFPAGDGAIPQPEAPSEPLSPSAGEPPVFAEAAGDAAMPEGEDLSQIAAAMQTEAAPEPVVPDQPAAAPEPEDIAAQLAAGETLETEQPGPQEPDPQPAAGTASAAAQGEGSGKSLEETVGEMLRPMLREWLDENMPRLVQKSLSEELGSGGDKS
ncbi:MAG: hypothetical protein Kow0032_23240 [Methyloligellaceae bacterium]